jgi:hypothetical protein
VDWDATYLDSKGRAEICGKVADALEHLEPLIQFPNLEVRAEESVFLPSNHKLSE